MNRFVKTACVAAFIVLGLAATAQSTATATGFNVQTLIQQLSLYLPEDLAQGAVGFRAPPAGMQPQAQAGAGTGAQTQSGAAAQLRSQFQFTRDPKNYLTKDQTTKLIPIFQGLHDNPLPSPTKAKKIQADVDGILSASQKSAYDAFQKEIEKARQNAQTTRTAGGTGAAGNGQAQNFRNMTDAERQQFLNTLPADQRQQFQQRAAQGSAGGAGGASGGQQLTETERRQRQVDEFIAVLQNWQKQAK